MRPGADGLASSFGLVTDATIVGQGNPATLPDCAMRFQKESSRGWRLAGRIRGRKRREPRAVGWARPNAQARRVALRQLDGAGPLGKTVGGLISNMVGGCRLPMINGHIAIYQAGPFWGHVPGRAEPRGRARPVTGTHRRENQPHAEPIWDGKYDEKGRRDSTPPGAWRGEGAARPLPSMSSPSRSPGTTARCGPTGSP